MASFRDHDWDADTDWAAYLRRVEIPTNSAADLLKVKAKWWKREKDPGFDVAAALGTAQPLPTSTSSSSQQQQQQQPRASPPPQQQQAPPPPRGAPGGGGGGGGAAAWLGAAAGLLGDPEGLLFGVNAGILLGSLIYLVPLGATSMRAYRTALLCCVVSNAMMLTKQCGTCAANLQALQQWAVRALPNQHFGSAILALMFLTSPPPVTLVLAPFFISALYLVTSHLSARHAAHPLWQQAQGARFSCALAARRQQALGLCAQLEIALGFTMMYMVFTPQRAMMVTYFVWQQLRQRYWGAETGAYHRAAWAGIDAATRPLRNAAPMVDRYISILQRWFVSARPIGAQR